MKGIISALVLAGVLGIAFAPTDASAAVKKQSGRPVATQQIKHHRHHNRHVRHTHTGKKWNNGKMSRKYVGGKNFNGGARHASHGKRVAK